MTTSEEDPRYMPTVSAVDGVKPRQSAKPEVVVNGLATKLTGGGTAALVAVAIVDAVVNGRIDQDSLRAALGAVVLAAVLAIGKYAQAVAGIIADALERRAAALFTRAEVEEAAGQAAGLGAAAIMAAGAQPAGEVVMPSEDLVVGVRRIVDEVDANRAGA